MLARQKGAGWTALYSPVNGHCCYGTQHGFSVSLSVYVSASTALGVCAISGLRRDRGVQRQLGEPLKGRTGLLDLRKKSCYPIEYCGTEKCLKQWPGCWALPSFCWAYEFPLSSRRLAPGYADTLLSTGKVVARCEPLCCRAPTKEPLRLRGHSTAAGRDRARHRIDPSGGVRVSAPCHFKPVFYAASLNSATTLWHLKKQTAMTFCT